MFDTPIIKQLKQTNISVDKEKTKQRVGQVWKQATAADKKAVAALADVAINTIYRVISTGSLSAKIAVALGQTAGVSPFYLIGEDISDTHCDDDVIIDFLQKKKYGDLVQEHHKEQKKAAHRAKKLEKQAAEEAAQSSEPTEAEVVHGEDPVPEEQAALSESTPPDVSDEDIMALIGSLKIKAKLGVKTAEDALKQIYSILLS